MPNPKKNQSKDSAQHSETESLLEKDQRSDVSNKNKSYDESPEGEKEDGSEVSAADRIAGLAVAAILAFMKALVDAANFVANSPKLDAKSQALSNAIDLALQGYPGKALAIAFGDADSAEQQASTPEKMMRALLKFAGIEKERQEEISSTTAVAFDKDSKEFGIVDKKVETKKDNIASILEEENFDLEEFGDIIKNGEEEMEHNLGDKTPQKEKSTDTGRT